MWRREKYIVNILILNHNVEWRGTFQRCYDFAKLIADRGHTVTLVTNSPAARFRFEAYEFDGIRIVRSPDLFWGILRTGWDPVNVLRRFLYLRKEKFDLIHAFDNRPAVILPALWLSRRWRCPLVSDWCDWWGRGGAITLRKNRILNALFSPVETFFEEHFRRYACFLTVISHPLKERAIRLGFSAEKIEVIPPLVNVEKIFPVHQREARKRLGLERYTHVIIFSGFVLYDLDMVLQAFQIVHQRYPDCLLLLTGGVPQKMIAHVRHLPVVNIGFVSQEKLCDYLGASDLCLMPLADHLTNQARFPHKIGHYLAAGRPVVSNPVGDAGRFLKEHGVGFLCQPTVSDFAAGICGALNLPEQLQEMGKKARLVAEKHLSGAEFGVRLEHIYNTCLTQSGV